jgi:hypothetical protein
VQSLNNREPEASNMGLRLAALRKVGSAKEMKMVVPRAVLVALVSP